MTGAVVSFKLTGACLGLCAAGVLIASPSAAQSAARPPSATLLRDLSASVEELTARVRERRSGAGHRIRSRRRAHARRRTGLVIGRQHSIGSGAIIDPDGYIITNAHVVAGARHIQVVLHHDTTTSRSGALARGAAGQTVDARVVGTPSDIDLALLKVDRHRAARAPVCRLRRDPAGRAVFAFGSPEGLRNSVTMGVVSPWRDSRIPTARPSIFRPTHRSIRATAAVRW